MYYVDPYYQLNHELDQLPELKGQTRSWLPLHVLVEIRVQIET